MSGACGRAANAAGRRVVAIAAGMASMLAVAPATATAAPPGASTHAGVSAASPTLGPVQHVKANGLSFGYRVGGTGTPLIMVMGRSGTMAEWDPQLIKQLIRDHRVVIFDNRGMGTTSSNFSANTVTVPLMAKDTLALASALHIQRFEIMGWSMGGEISQQVTVDAPNRVLKVVLCATSAGGPTEQLPSKVVQQIMSEPNLPAPLLLGLSFPPTRAGIQGEFSYAARVYGQYVHDKLPTDSFSSSTAGKAGQAHARAQWTSASGGVYDALPKVTQRVLVMWGDLDVVDPPANDRTIAKRLPHATTHVFSGAGHAFLFQDAVQVGQRADRFLSAG